MLQIVIIGMAIMLIVKALEVQHRDAIAKKAGHGSLGPALITSVVAILGAIFLFFASAEQARQMPSPSSSSPLDFR
jgi:hypothetical protein